MRAELDPSTGARRAAVPVTQRWRIGQLTRLEWALLVGAALSWLLFTFGTALASQWFPMDVPWLYEKGSDLREWLPRLLSPYDGSGRYYPVYWLYWLLQYPLFGDAVWPYLVVQSTIFLGGAAAACTLVYRATHSALASLLLFAGIYLSSPIAENLVTIGKGEPLSLVLVLCAVALFQRTRLQGRHAVVAASATALLFAVAVWTKETAMVLLGFAAVGAIVAALTRKLRWWGGEAPALRPWLLLLVALAAGLALTRVPYFVFPQSVAGHYYTDYQVTAELVGDNLRFYAEQLPDLLITGGLGTMLLLLAFRRVATGRLRLTREQGEHLVLMLSICAMGWGYSLAMQAWRWPMVYYMLLPAVAFRIAAVYAIWLHLRTSAASPAMRRFLLGAMALAFAWGGLMLYYVSASQVAYSRIYTRALRQVADVIEPGARLVIESYPFFAEQVKSTSALLLRQLKKPVTVHGVGELMDPAVLKPDLLRLLDVKPRDIEANIQHVPRRGDYLLAFTGSKLASWFLRGVTPYFMPDSFFKREGNYRMELVGGSEITLPSPFLHVWNHRPAADLTWVGYKLYRVLDDEPKFLWSGRFPDGWVGEQSTLYVNAAYGKPLQFVVSAPQYVLPITVTIRRDGKLARQLELTTPQEVWLDLGPAPAAGTRIDFDVPKHFVGRDVHLNRDERKLAARIALVDAPTQVLPAVSRKGAP